MPTSFGTNQFVESQMALSSEPSRTQLSAPPKTHLCPATQLNSSKRVMASISSESVQDRFADKYGSLGLSGSFGLSGKEQIMTSDYIPIATAAKELPVDPETIRRWILVGLAGRKLAAKRCGYRWFVRIVDLVAFAEASQ